MLFRSDRKSTRLNSSHLVISYAVFCLKKKKKNNNNALTATTHSVHSTPIRHELHTPSHRTCPVLWLEPAHLPLSPLFFFFFFNDTATTEIYTLSLHDALPIYLIPDFRLPKRVVRTDVDFVK